MQTRLPFVCNSRLELLSPAHDGVGNANGGAEGECGPKLRQEGTFQEQSAPVSVTDANAMVTLRSRDNGELRRQKWEFIKKNAVGWRVTTVTRPSCCPHLAQKGLRDNRSSAMSLKSR